MNQSPELYYVCPALMDGRQLSPYTADRDQAKRYLLEARQTNPSAVLAVLLTSFDAE